MSHYRQSLVLEADPAAVYAALTTPKGLRGWWTQNCDVATEVGGTIQFRFGHSYKNMRIERLEPDREVCWFCTGAHIAVDQLAHKDEWVGTQLVFRLTPDGEERTRVDFEHVGLVPAFQCYDLCSIGWRHYLNSLQQFVETGRGTPHELAAE
ncbi:MAG: SRPBCC domain-containing protein [Methylococcus sp.]|nr:SRPBCC domain-containing protein [Methylococcus sp.]